MEAEDSPGASAGADSAPYLQAIGMVLACALGTSPFDRARLDLSHAAIDEEFDAGDVATVVGG
jgi:hypothetical protein